MRISEQSALDFIPQSLNWRALDTEWVAKAVLISALNPSFTDYRKRLYSYLLGSTAQHAFEFSPFYAHHLEACRSMLVNDEPFVCEALPILTRAMMERSLADIPIQADDLYPSYTSGTTTGRSLMLLHADSGRQCMREILRSFKAVSPRTERKERGYILKLAFQAYGHKADVDVLPVISKLNAGMEKAMDLLNPDSQNPGDVRISVVSGGPYDLVDLTLVAQDRFGASFERAAEHIKELHTTGTYVSTHLKSWLENAWQAQLYDTLSFSEMPIHATSCKHCGTYHFHPVCHVEILDSRGQPLDSGRGRLVLTPVYPTVQATHLIRYEVGDYLEKIRVDCRAGFHGYKFLGRYHGSVNLSPDQSEEEFLGIAEVIDLLDDLPDVARPRLRHNIGYPGKLRDSKHWPLFEIRNSDGKLSLHIQLVYVPAAFPERTNELQALLRQRIARRLPWIMNIHDSRRVAIEFLPPKEVVM